MLSKSLRTNSVNVSEVMKKAEIERLKGKVVSNAVNKIISIINSITGSVDCKVFKSNTEKLSGDRLFTGLLILTASVTDKGTLKTINIPIRVSNSMPTIPNKVIIKGKLSQIESNSIEKKTAHLSENVIKVINEREKKAKNIVEDGKEKRAIERKGKEYKLPSGGFSYVPSGEIAQSIRYPKVSLPQSIKVGDVIDIGGRKYKIEEGLNSFRGEQPSTEWNLILQE